MTTDSASSHPAGESGKGKKKSDGSFQAKEHGHHQLGEFASTAICGNDITSSCLYVSALSIFAAGKMAPFALLLVAAMLFLFRAIYAEVVGALPLNGGAYNALLNTTSKSRASIAACLTILSYMATAVISAGEAMHYAANLWNQFGTAYEFPVVTATMLLLLAFTGITIMGISESARVAIGIFVTHLVTLTLLLLIGVVFVLFFSKSGTKTFWDNMGSELMKSEEVKVEDEHESNIHPSPSTQRESAHAPPENAEQDENTSNESSEGTHQKKFEIKPIGFGSALFFGFAVALLGISGFESSANFVEEQGPGVFPKTLRNMWMAVSFFNPAMAFLALALIPLPDIQGDAKMQTALLAEMGKVAGGGGWFGGFLSSVISIDAFLVLSGAVLTSFVGVNGLVHRMTLDRCLPQFLLKTNSRGTTHRILIMFFLMSASVLLITMGDIGKLAGVYTISFLTVMALFAIGNILLKVKRSKIPRPVRASWISVIVAISAVLIGLAGNAIKNPEYVMVFLYYFVPTMAVVAIMLYRIPLLKICLSMVKAAASALEGPLNNTAKFVRNKIEEINSQQVVFFTRGDNIANLNKAMLYVSSNEDTNRIKVVTVVKDSSEVPEKLEHDLRFLDEAYPHIDIDFVSIEGEFGPDLIRQLSQEWNVPTNLMFIGSPGRRMVYGLAELGGVRLII